MAYCSNCGAYIPDGESKCLACGFDEAAEKSASAAAAAKTERTDMHHASSNSYDSEVLRRQLEEQRRKQQENSRKWAEAERRRRMQQEEEQRKAKASYTSTYTEAKRSNAADGNNRNIGAGTGFSYAAICYLWGLWLIPLIFNRNDRFIMYHVKQGIALSIAATLATMAASVFGMGWLVTVGRIYMMVKGIKNANAGRYEPLPYIGEYAEKF